MSVGDVPPESSFRRARLGDSLDRWSIRLGRVCGVEIVLSSSAVVAGVIGIVVGLLLVSRTSSNELPAAAGLATVFWVAGWLVQLVTYIGVSRLLVVAPSRVGVGVLGVEFSPQICSAGRTLMLCLVTWGSLLVLGAAFRAVDGDLQVSVLSRLPSQVWATPSIGFGAHDSVWRSGAWLCWVQAICQLFPLPRSIGRYILGGLVTLCGWRLTRQQQSRIVRQCLLVIAGLAVVAGIALLFSQQANALNGSFPKWPLAMLLGMMLFRSRRAADVTLMIEGFYSGVVSAERQRLDSERDPKAGIVQVAKEKVQDFQGQRRAKKAYQQEQEEAVDVKRLDEILNRLHADGPDSLSQQDRLILKRVSENLRNQRKDDEP